MTPWETRIREALQASAELPVTVQDVAQAQALFRSRQAESTRRPRAVLVTASVALTVVVALVWWLVRPGTGDAGPTDHAPAPQPRQTTQPTPSTVSADNRVGIVGPPPPGTAPTGPATGELVAAAAIYNSGSWVYADGRIINVVHNHLGSDKFKGYVVRYLTPSGVEAMRTFLLDGTPKLTPGSTDDLGLIVRDGGRLMTAQTFDRCGAPRAGPFPAPQNSVCPAFEHPERWLPASAWEDPTLQPFVPHAFQVCMWSHTDPALLPATAADIFLASPRHGGAARTVEDCRDVATSDARTIANVLEDAGAIPDEYQSLAFGLQSLGGDSQSRLWFEPILPHGATYCTECG